MTLSPELELEIVNYCTANNIKDIDAFKIKMLKQGFTIEKYGSIPFQSKEKKVVEEKKDVEVKEPEITGVTEEKIIKKDLYGEG